jgi:hypothetical protein
MPDSQPPTAALRLHIRMIAESPLFAYQARLAHELGLLAPLLAGDEEAVSRRSRELLSTVFAIRSQAHQPVQDQPEILSDRHGMALPPALEPSTQTDELLP